MRSPGRPSPGDEWTDYIAVVIRSFCCRRASLARTALALLAFPSACATVRAGSAPSNNAGAVDVVGPASAARVMERADSAWRAASYPLATSLYEALVAADSSASRPVFRLATLRAWSNRLDDAEGLFRRYVALEPRDTEGRLALARALAWGAKYSAAIAIYDSVIAVDSTYRDAVVGRAQTLTWEGRADEGLQMYRLWTTAHPADREALLEYARALSWNGQLNDAEQIYRPLASSGNADAQKGLARVTAWGGQLQQSLEAWRQIVAARPADPEALTGLGQVLHWLGRDAEADAALALALRANPGYGDARVLRRWVDAVLRPAVTLRTSGSDDSDHNRATNLMLRYEQVVGAKPSLGGEYTGRHASLASIDSRVDAVSAFVRWQSGVWRLRGDGGVSRHSSTLVLPTAGPRTLASAGVHASGLLGRVLEVTLDATRAPFDETARLIASGVVSSEYGGDAVLALPARFALSGAASRAQLTGGARDNARNAFSSALRWNYNRRWSVGIGARRFGYDTTSSDGYFSPRKYTLAELSGRGRVGAELGWNADGDVGIGRQNIEFYGFSAPGRIAERIALSAGYRFDPAREIILTSRYGNVAAPGQTGGTEYRSYSLGLAARLGL